MTRRELIEKLVLAGIEAADVEATLLFSYFGGITAAECMASPLLSLDTPLFLLAVERRLAREPLAHILGYTDFYKETYHVTPDVLVPRPDTECLVEHAIHLLPRSARFADLCTGSGCVAISVLASRKDTTADAMDVSERALLVAAQNAVQNGVPSRVRFLRKDLLCEPLCEGPYHAILANPPYIPKKELKALSPEVQREPAIALDGGEDGMVFYRRFLRDFTSSLLPDGFFLFEIGFDQGDAICALAGECGMTATVFPDYGGRDRVALVRPDKNKRIPV